MMIYLYIHNIILYTTCTVGWNQQNLLLYVYIWSRVGRRPTADLELQVRCGVGEPIRRGHVARRFARISAHDRIGSTSPRSSRLANGGHVHAHQEAEQETLPQHSHPEPTRAKD